MNPFGLGDCCKSLQGNILRRVRAVPFDRDGLGPRPIAQPRIPMLVSGHMR